jgi:hypothetical protein
MAAITSPVSTPRAAADAKLTDLLVTLANCEKARSVSVHDRCQAKFEGFTFRS